MAERNAAMKFEDIRQRPATFADKPFVNGIFRMVMKPYIEGTWADESEREACYARNDACNENTVILEYDGKPIGYFSVKRPPGKLIFYQAHLFPEYQGKGIGTSIIRQVLREAEEKNLSVKLTALQINPACRLYQKMGFRIARSDEFRHFMRWEP